MYINCYSPLANEWGGVGQRFAGVSMPTHPKASPLLILPFFFINCPFLVGQTLQGKW